MSCQGDSPFQIQSHGFSHWFRKNIAVYFKRYLIVMKMSKSNQGSFWMWPFSCLPFTSLCWDHLEPRPIPAVCSLHPPPTLGRQPWPPSPFLWAQWSQVTLPRLWEQMDGTVFVFPTSLLTHRRRERTGRTGAHVKQRRSDLTHLGSSLECRFLMSPHSRFPFSVVRCGPRNLCLEQAAQECPHVGGLRPWYRVCKEGNCILFPILPNTCIGFLGLM